MLTYPEIDPIIFALGPSEGPLVRADVRHRLPAGLVAGKAALQERGSPINAEQVDDLLFYGMLGVILGGRVGYALFYGLSNCYPIRFTCSRSPRVACRFMAVWPAS